MATKQSIQTIHPTKWGIPLPQRPRRQYHFDQDLNSRSTYEAACTLLKSLGFEQITAISGYGFETHSSSSPPRDFSLWCHPAGAFVRASSYDKRLNSMDLDVEFNCGYGWERYKKAGEISGSGGSYVKMDGTNGWDRHFSTGGYSSSSFMRTLHAVQSHSRLVPIKDWERKNEMGVHIPVESYFTFMPTEDDKGLSNQYLQEKYAAQIKQAQTELLNNCPEYVKPLFEAAFIQADRRPIRLNEQNWAKAENALDLYGEVLEAAKIAWPTLAESELLTAWSMFAVNPESELDLGATRANEVGPGGLTLAHTLLACLQRDSNKNRLIELFEKVDHTTRLKWVSEPDGSGNTLMSHALKLLGSHRFAAGSTLFGRAVKGEDVIEVLSHLVELVGATNVILCPQEAPALGALIGFVSDKSRKPSLYPDHATNIQLGAMVGLIEKSHELGVSVFDPSNARQVEMLDTLKQLRPTWVGLDAVISICESELLKSRVSLPSASFSRPRF